jgi:hypothetical protein
MNALCIGIYLGSAPPSSLIGDGGGGEAEPIDTNTQRETNDPAVDTNTEEI